MTGRRFSKFLLLALLLSWPAGRPLLRAQQTPEQKSERAIREVLDRQTAAWNKGDLDGFMNGYWKSRELTFFSSGAATRGWKATLSSYRKRYASEGKEMGRLDFPEETIELLGSNAALVRGRWRLKFSSGREARGLTTLVMRRLPEGWRIVHDHSSAE